MDSSGTDPSGLPIAADDRDRAAIAITVTRTGGIAGMRRTWHARPQTTDASQWITLLKDCPWDEADPSRPIVPTGADRYMWHVDATCGDEDHEAALPDPEVRGPWRDLIDAVRSISDRKVGTS
jgi:hypothetical protein